MHIMVACQNFAFDHKLDGASAVTRERENGDAAGRGMGDGEVENSYIFT